MALLFIKGCFPCSKLGFRQLVRIPLQTAPTTTSHRCSLMEQAPSVDSTASDAVVGKAFRVKDVTREDCRKASNYALRITLWKAESNSLGFERVATMACRTPSSENLICHSPLDIPENCGVLIMSKQHNIGHQQFPDSVLHNVGEPPFQYPM